MNWNFSCLLKDGVQPTAEIPDEFLGVAVLVVGAGGLKTLLDFLPGDESLGIVLFPLADPALHLFLGGGPQLPNHLSRPGQIDPESTEVDAMPKGIDLRLLIQLIAQLCELCDGFCQDFLRPLLAVHDGVPVIHEHAREGTAEILIEIVKKFGQIVNRTDMTGLMPQGKSFHLVDVKPQQAAKPLV